MTPINELNEIMNDNKTVVRMLSEYINLRPRFLTREMVENLAHECEVSTDEAFRTLFAAACGLDTCDNRWHRHLEKCYLIPSVHRLDPSRYDTDAYLQAIQFPTQKSGKWEMCQHSYAPFEPFVCNHPVLTREFREIPQIGYFDDEFTFPAILENGIEWMTVTPNEVETMREPIMQSVGKVLTLGLGLGYFAFHASEKPSVESVTVIEKDAEVIKLFQTYLLPQFPNRHKIRIIEADAFAYMETFMPREKYDFIFSDIWHDPSDGLELYLKLKKLEPLSPSSRFAYWIEPSLLSLLRHMVWARITDPTAPLQLRGMAPESLLTDKFLRTLNLTRL